MSQVNLIASNKYYVCAEAGGGWVGTGSLIANRSAPDIWERFDQETFDDGVSFKTHNRTYITAELDGTVSTDRTSRGSWERWHPVDGGYRSAHGKFLRIDADGLVYADEPTLTDRTKFTTVQLQPTITLSRLSIRNRYFYNEEGQRVFVKGTTDFMLYKYFLEGKDIEPLLQQRRDNGVMCVRIIGMVSWFDYTPQKYGQAYYDNIPAFLDLCAKYGLYVYWTVFADTRIVMPGLNDQLNHFNKVVAQLKTRTNAFGELVNEPYTGSNATANPMAFTRPTGIAFSSGSYSDKYGGNVTPPPYWDFHDFHVPRKDGKRVADQCVVTHPNYVQKGMSIFSGESDKFGGPNEHNPEVYMNDPDQSRQMYQTSRGSASGYVYHTSAGNFSVLWNRVEITNCPFLMEA